MLGLFTNDKLEDIHKELMKDHIDAEKIQKLINDGAKIHEIDEKGRTLLFELSKKHKIESIKILLDNKVDINSEDNYGKTVLTEAVHSSDGMMIRFLLDNGTSVNYANSEGRTALQDSVLEGNIKAFRVLMTKNPNLNLKDNYGKYILFDGVESGNIGILKEIVNNLDDLNQVDNTGQTALFHAILKEDLIIANFLITHGTNINHLDNMGQNILFNAVVLGMQNIKIITFLIEKGIDLNIQDKDEKNLLDEILKLVSIQKNSEDIKVDSKYRFVNKKRNYLQLTAFLIDNDLAINRLDKEGKTVLYREVAMGNYETVDFLLSSGASINALDNEGKTVLFDAILKGFGNIKMIDYLILKGVNIDQENNEHKTIVDDLCEIILIQENNKKPSSKRFSDIDKNGDYFQLLKTILIFKPNLNQIKTNGQTLIFDIMQYDNMALIRLIANGVADFNLRDNNGQTLLSILITKGLKEENDNTKEIFLEKFVFLLKFRIDINMIYDKGQTVCHQAVLANNLDIVQKLLNKNINFNIRDEQGRTALHHTQWKGNDKIAKILISAGSNINEADNAGFTLLNYATILGHIKLLEVLIISGVLMFNHNKKNKKMALFFKSKEKNLENLLSNSTMDEKIKHDIKEVVNNFKKELNEAIQ